jgi:glycosyltransferase involved in cell wall biosynthesis
MRTQRILILSHYFPPEVNAPANRIFELGRAWVEAGHQVTVVTCAPNHPKGVIYPGYRNRLWYREKIAGIEVIRLWTALAANEGFVRRTLNYFSYLIAVVIGTPFFPKADIVLSTSPQFFCGLAGYPVSRLRRIPWILEIRDLWPESIVAVGAMRQPFIIRALQTVERFAYRHAKQIVSVSDAFIPHFEGCGVSRRNISVIPNGVDMADFGASHTTDADSFRALHGLQGKFVVAYIGTHGMAHGLETILHAADRLRARDDITFILVGDGAERERLLAQHRTMALPNVLMLPQMPRAEIPGVWAASDAALVLLRDRPTFELVIPSKMLEAFAMGKPVVLGVRGKAKNIIESNNCGLAFTPEDADDLARVVTLIADDNALAQRLGKHGRQLAASSYDRRVLAHQYLELLTEVAASRCRH